MIEHIITKTALYQASLLIHCHCFLIEGEARRNGVRHLGRGSSVGLMIGNVLGQSNWMDERFRCSCYSRRSRIIR